MSHWYRYHPRPIISVCGAWDTLRYLLIAGTSNFETHDNAELETPWDGSWLQVPPSLRHMTMRSLRHLEIPPTLRYLQLSRSASMHLPTLCIYPHPRSNIQHPASIYQHPSHIPWDQAERWALSTVWRVWARIIKFKESMDWLIYFPSCDSSWLDV